MFGWSGFISCSSNMAIYSVQFHLTVCSAYDEPYFREAIPSELYSDIPIQRDTTLDSNTMPGSMASSGQSTGLKLRKPAFCSQLCHWPVCDPGQMTLHASVSPSVKWGWMILTSAMGRTELHFMKAFDISKFGFLAHWNEKPKISKIFQERKFQTKCIMG